MTIDHSHHQIISFLRRLWSGCVRAASNLNWIFANGHDRWPGSITLLPNWSCLRRCLSFAFCLDKADRLARRSWVLHRRLRALLNECGTFWAPAAVLDEYLIEYYEIHKSHMIHMITWSENTLFYICPLSSFLDPQQCAGRQQGPDMVIILTSPARAAWISVKQRKMTWDVLAHYSAGNFCLVGKSDESHPQIAGFEIHGRLEIGHSTWVSGTTIPVLSQLDCLHKFVLE